MILLLVVMFSQGDKVSIHSCPLIQGECHSVDMKLLQGAIVWFISFQILSPDLRGALELTLSIRVRSYLIRSFSVEDAISWAPNESCVVLPCTCLDRIRPIRLCLEGFLT